MSYDKCFDKVIDEIFLDQETGQLKDMPFDSPKFRSDLNERANKYFMAYKDQFPGEDLLALKKKAHVDALKDLSDETMARVHRIERQAEIQSRFDKLIGNSAEPTWELTSAIKRADLTGEGIFGAAVQGPLYKFQEQFRSKLPGNIDRFFNDNEFIMEDVVRSLSGEKVESKLATGFANAIREMRTLMNNKFEALGTRINQLDNYDLAHKWNMFKVQKATAKQFVADVIPRLDTTQMRNLDGTPMTRQELIDTVQKVAEDIIRGRDLRPEGRSISSLGSRFNRRRVLHFKSADDYLDLHKKYGEGTLFRNTVDQLQNMAKDLAILQEFGPYAESTFKAAEKARKTRIADDSFKVTGKEQFARATVPKNMWANLTGDVFRLENPDSSISRAVADIGSAVGSGTSVPIHLGFAPITATIDLANVRQASKLFGLSFGKVLKASSARLVGLDKTPNGKSIGRAATGMIDDINAGLHLSGRFEDMTPYGKFSRMTAGLSDFVVRGIGLHKWTVSAKQGFGKMLNAEVAGYKGKSFKELPEAFRELFKVMEIGPKEWDMIQSSIKTTDGFTYVDLESLLKKDVIAGGKFTGFIREASRRAVPEAGIEARAMIKGSDKPDTLAGVMRTFLGNLKSFTVSNTLNQIYNTFLNPAVLNRSNYFVNYALAATALGAFAVQMQQVTFGRDMYSWDDSELWTKAILKANVLSVVGDVGASVADRSPLQKAAAYAFPGPAAYFELFKHLFDVGGKAVKGDTEGALGDLVAGMSRLPPSNFWYTSLIAKRMFWEKLEQMANPKAKKKARRSAKRRRKRTGQEEYWKYGDSLPNRAPQFAKDPEK